MAWNRGRVAYADFFTRTWHEIRSMRSTGFHMTESFHPPFSIKRAAKLNVKKHREIEWLFLAEGEALIREAKETPRHIFDEPEQIKRISSLAASADPVGVFSFVDVPMEELFSGRGGGAEESEGGRESRSDAIVLLHGVQDPGNVGTVIRSAYAFGAGIALSVGCADLYNPKTVRGTMGAIFHVPISREVDSVEFLRIASENSFSSVAAMVEGGGAPRKLPDGKLVVVVGAEGSGLPEEVVKACDGRVAIPSEAASLNAAVAASILLYEAHSRVLT